MIWFRTRLFALAVLPALALGCVEDDAADLSSTASSSMELDVIALAARPARLLVLADGSDAAARRRLERGLATIGGAIVTWAPPRLAIAQVPAGTDAILADLGVIAHFERRVTAADVPGATVAEERVLDVYSNRWFPAEVPPRERIVARRAIRAEGEAFEAPAGPIAARLTAADSQPDPEDQVSVPYASGTVVVSIVLPESNGVAEASSEDWTEAQIRETQLKIQAALDTIAAAEPNADLRFVVHTESAPGPGGLVGTVDSDYEFGRHAQWGDWTGETMVTSHVLGRILGREVPANDAWPAAVEYTTALKRQYDADAAYFVLVAANGNFTAGLRAHAYLNGPWTTLDSTYGMEVFTHEFGHIFGAQDEYCPDACQSPSGVHGYLGIYNANATFRPGDIGGIGGGKGEDAPSLMQFNQVGAINGYTRGAWGWLDTDGDGIVEVRDTLPRSELALAVDGNAVHVTGTVIDQPESRLGSPRYSANRIVALEYRVGDGAWFRRPLAGDRRGRQAVDLTIGGLPAGSHRLALRAINSVGNTEPAKVHDVVVTATGNAAPHLTLVADRAVTSATAGAVIQAVVSDLDGDAVQVRLDSDGDGSFDTAWAAPGALAIAPAPGVVTITGEARDARGAVTTASLELLVVDGDAPPALALSALPGIVHGSDAVAAQLAATVSDPEGDAVELNWIAELVTNDDSVRVESGWGQALAWQTVLTTPRALVPRRLDLSAGLPELTTEWIRQVLPVGGDVLAVAAGPRGVWFLDIADRANPRFITRLDLETTASHLLRQGSKLFVVGSRLTVVDVANPRAPRELKQRTTDRSRRVLASSEAVDIVEQPDWGAGHYLSAEHGERIADARVSVTIQHARPADLLIRLHPPQSSGVAPIVLWDHRTAGSGRRTYSFNSGNTPALRQLNGLFAFDGWNLEVVDDQVNGKTGRLLASEIELTTASRAVELLPSASRAVGLIGNDLVVAGAGLQVLDVSTITAIRERSRVTGLATAGAALVGASVVWAGMPIKRPTAGTPVEAQIEGLAAVDLSRPSRPRVVRDVRDLGQTIELVEVGSRVYVRTNAVCEERGCGEPSTLVVDGARFVAGRSGWRLGTTHFRIDASAFGDDRSLYSVGDEGMVQRFDVSNPAAITRSERYARPAVSAMVPLGGGEIVLFTFSAEAQIVNLAESNSILSRTYRITAEARDGAGGVTRASRTVQVVPYAHAPVITAATATAPQTDTDAWVFHVSFSDADSNAWDSTRLARLDFDGDGAWDTDWNWMGLTDGTIWTPWTPAPGQHRVRLQLRDGFWATTETELLVDVP
jgi:subtilisin-like proprotein convertase family protein